MLQLVKIFWEIALFQRGPQDLPVSVFLFRLSATAYLLVGIAVVLLPLPFLPMIAIAVVDTVLMAVLIAASLYLRKRQARILQTLTATYGTLALLGLPMLPVTGWLLHADSIGGSVALASTAFWGFYFWSIAVLGHILRQAMGIPLFHGLLISYSYFFLWHQFAPLFLGDTPSG
jgi:energy-converting hydrogenase Eha subunit C